MTTSDELTNNGTGTAPGSGTDKAPLPLHPWTALHPATGMLLGTDDFELLMGNPRGKHQLHNAWLHGRGVVWGLDVKLDGDWNLEVSPGLALDGTGRELHLEASRCVSFKKLLEDQHDPTKTSEVELCLVMRFDACLDGPVPALIDPCDVARETTEYSRVVERVRLEVVSGRPPGPARPYRRVRMLLGLSSFTVDDAGKDARRRRDEVAAAPSARRAKLLLRHFRCLVAKDAAQWKPSTDSWFPTDEQSSGVLLACVRLTVEDESGYPSIVDSDLDVCRRPTLVPTGVIQDLVCALAPGLIGTQEDTAGLGPQVIEDSIDWSNDCEELRFKVSEDLVPGSLRRAVTLSSLSDTEWVVEDLMGPPRYHADTNTVVVKLADRPANRLIRLVVRGTGATPVYGADTNLPLAGVLGDLPGSEKQGLDAVVTVPNPRFEGKEST